MPSFTIISRIQCWLYSIRGQIIMSNYFHINKKKSIIFSIVLVRFLTIVRGIYKIQSEQCHKKYEHNAPARAWHAIHCGKCSLASSRQKNSLNLHTQSLGDQWLQFALASIFRLRVLHNKHFESTLLCSNVRPILFEFRDLQYIQYNMEQRYI